MRYLLLALTLTVSVATTAYAEPTTEAVYGEGQVYESDVADRHLQYTTHQQQGDDLVLTSGAIVTSDAFVIFGAQPADRTFAPGQYPVVLTLTRDNEGDLRVAYARVEFGQGQPIRWEPASTFSAESGIGAFLDADAVSHATDDYDPYGKLVLGAVALAVQRDEYWSAVLVDPDSGADAVVFTTGYGEGTFTTYWGFDENDTPVALVADFNVLAP